MTAAQRLSAPAQRTQTLVPGAGAALSRYPGALELTARAGRGERPAQLALLGAIAASVERLLYRVLGGDAPLAPLLEAALLRAINHAAEYAGDEPLATWAERLAVQVATAYLCGARPAETEPRGPANDVGGSVRTLLARVHARLRRVRPEERVAFALLELDGRSLLDAARLLGAAPGVVRQRAARARRHLLFAARRDRTIAAYLQLSERLRALAARLQRERPASRPSAGARHLFETLVGALHAQP
jgi:DNA-directed RNA polymerase specialized sigma24 family protein